MSLFFYTEAPFKALPILKAYYVFALKACGSLLDFSIKTTEIKASTHLRYFIIALYSMFLIVTILPGIGISRAESIGYSVTRIASPFYILIQIGLAGGLTLAMAALLKGIRARNLRIKKRAPVLLTSVSAVIFVVISMQLGAHFNATIIVSITTSIMMVVLIYTQDEHRLFNFLSFIPSTQESRDLQQAMTPIDNPELSFKEAREAFSDTLIRRALQAANEDNNKDAKRLDISMPTLYRHLKFSKEANND